MENKIGGQRLGGRNQDGTTKSEEFFLVSGFRSHVVATTVCATGVYTHSVSNAHFPDTFSSRGVRTSRTRTAQGVCSAHVTSLHLLFTVRMFHPPSLLFPHGLFDTSFPSAPPSLSNCSRSESAGQAHFRTHKSTCFLTALR